MNGLGADLAGLGASPLALGQNCLFSFLYLYPLPTSCQNILPSSYPARELKEGYWFNPDFIPPVWSDRDFLQVYAWRPAIESGNSEHNTFYYGQRMNTRGNENAVKDRALDYILDWLKALAATKLNRPDLLCKWTAFSAARDYLHHTTWANVARSSGYLSLVPPRAWAPTKTRKG